ncbi:MAG: PLP-dependent aminotransferase family protein [Variovorax sp.]|nr:PLP-dependent aminotransferase family protein [Variovorax sp.]
MPDQFWIHLFALPRDSTLPLQVQLRSVVLNAIHEERLLPGAALPSSRDLAKLLGLSRNTVSAAYEQLVDSGYLAARPRAGVFVADAPPAQPGQPVNLDVGGGHRPPHWSRRMLRKLADRPTLSKPEDWRGYPYPFVYGHYDPQQFPVEDFRECCVRSLARSQLPDWTPDFEQEDVPALVEQIRTRLLPKRGVHAQKNEILVTVGAQQCFHLLAELLLEENTRLGFEEPGYPHARNTFSLREPRFLRVPVDGDGVRMDRLPPLDYLFVTPSHQSPTTATLSLERRRRLLERAEQDDFVLIEDDYEAENIYTGEVMPALKSVDRAGRVIYVGSLSKSLSPAVRLGYIVAPSQVITELRALRHAMVRHPSAFLQHAYALFISLGHHEAHARRVNLVMAERMQRCAQALRKHLPAFRFELPGGGASIWVEGPSWLDCNQLAAAARRHGVLIEPGDVFFAEPPFPCPYFRLRLSSITAEQIGAGLQALARAVDELVAGRKRPA